MIIVCYACKKKSSDPDKEFYKNRDRESGYANECKVCASKRKKLFYLRTRGKRKHLSEKVKVRSFSYNHFSLENEKCSIINCMESAKELYHLDYKFPLHVIPLCQIHYKMAYFNLDEIQKNKLIKQFNHMYRI